MYVIERPDGFRMFAASVAGERVGWKDEKAAKRHLADLAAIGWDVEGFKIVEVADGGQ